MAQRLSSKAREVGTKADEELLRRLAQEPATIERKDLRYPKPLVPQGGMMLVEMTRAFAEVELLQIRQQIDPDSRKDYKLIDEVAKKMIATGLQRVNIPEEYGGVGILPIVNVCMALEELARGEAGILVAVGGVTWSFLPATLAGNKDVLSEWGPKACGDEPFIGCFAMTEPGGGCNIENLDMKGRGITTRARLEGDEWVINGVKTWPTNSGVADNYTVVCQTDPDLGDEGIALIHVPGDAKGLSFGPFHDKAGFRGARECEFYFDDVRVPKKWRVSYPGRDAELFHNNLVYARLFSAPYALGPAQGAFEEVLNFTKDRIAAGKPIRQHTVAANMLADMAIGIQAGRDCWINAGYLYDHAEECGLKPWDKYMLSRASIAKMFCCDTAIMVTNRAMELMGSYGYVTDMNVEKYWRDVKIIQLWEGGAQLGRLDVVRGYYYYDQFYINPVYEMLRA